MKLTETVYLRIAPRVRAGGYVGHFEVLGVFKRKPYLTGKQKAIKLAITIDDAVFLEQMLEAKINLEADPATKAMLEVLAEQTK